MTPVSIFLFTSPTASHRNPSPSSVALFNVVRLQPFSEMPWLKILFSPEMFFIYVAQFCAAWGSYTNLTSMPQYMEDVLKFNITAVSVIVCISYTQFMICRPIDPCSKQAHINEAAHDVRMFSEWISIVTTAFVPMGVLSYLCLYC